MLPRTFSNGGLRTAVGLIASYRKRYATAEMSALDIRFCEELGGPLAEETGVLRERLKPVQPNPMIMRGRDDLA
jgi:hypothetical protein